MVVMALPEASLMGVVQLRAAVPFKWTVQAPQRPMPQPNLVPVRVSSSRRNHKRGMAGSPSKLRLLPFTLSLIIKHSFFEPANCLFR